MCQHSALRDIIKRFKVCATHVVNGGIILGCVLCIMHMCLLMSLTGLRMVTPTILTVIIIKRTQRIVRKRNNNRLKSLVQENTVHRGFSV